MGMNMHLAAVLTFDGCIGIAGIGENEINPISSKNLF